MKIVCCKSETDPYISFSAWFLCSNSLMQTGSCNGTKRSLPFNLRATCKASGWNDKPRPVHICIISWLCLNYKCWKHLWIRYWKTRKSVQRRSLRFLEQEKGWIQGRHKSSLVILLTLSLEPHLLNYFKEADTLNALQAKVQGAPKQNWYRTADRRHFSAALLEIASKNVAWPSFKLPVTLLASGHSPSILKQMAACRNPRNLKPYLVRTLLSKARNGLKEEYAG